MIVGTANSPPARLVLVVAARLSAATIFSRSAIVVAALLLSMVYVPPPNVNVFDPAFEAAVAAAFISVAPEPSKVKDWVS